MSVLKKAGGFHCALVLVLTMMECQSSKDQSKLVIENDRLKVEVNVRGAELWSIRDKLTNNEMLWQGDTNYWADRAPVMFPVNVRFKGDMFQYKGKIYEMPFLGLVYGREFEIVKHENRKLGLQFESTPDILEHNYPFPFRFKVSFELVDNTLKQIFEIQNIGTDTMYYGLGGHPGFGFSRNPDERGRYSLRFGTEPLTVIRRLIYQNLMYGEEVPFLTNETSFSLDDERIPDAGMFIPDAPFRQVELVKDTESLLTFDLGNFPNINIWTPHGMPYVCLEPMVSHHDMANSPVDIQKKSHLASLAPNEKKEFFFSVIVN